MRRRGVLLLQVLLVLLLSACSSGSDSGGSSEGDPLVVYSGRNENLIGPLLEQFTESTGIPVTPRYGGSAELAAALLEEGEATRAQVFLSQDAGALGALQAEGRLAPLAQQQLDRVPASYRSPAGAWVGVSGRSRVLVYNTDLVQAADLPGSVLDLTRPEFRGKVAFAPTNASFQSFVTALRVLRGEDQARSFLQGFAANEPKAYPGNADIVNAVAAGQVPFGLVNHYYLYEKADGTEGGLASLRAANAYFTPGDPGALVNVAGVGVLTGKADERTARFVDFLLGEQAQRYFAQETSEFPLVAGVPTKEGLPPLADLAGPSIDLSRLDTLQESLALLSDVGLT
ncbi:MAG TPA: extracellular solute-binding protein [Mycobacteriales bacterium]|nr:extracellular solute-binding protein [Mycobacteriales bacterium]